MNRFLTPFPPPAFSQAVPVLGSDTPGIHEVVTPGVDGWLSPPGDAEALAALVRRAAADPQALRGLGLAGLDKARGLTHRRCTDGVVGSSERPSTGGQPPPPCQPPL